MPPGCFPFTDEEWQMISAHFRRRRILPVEEDLLRVLEESESKADVYWAVIGLRHVGSARAVPALKAKLHYPMQDVKDCTLLTIAHLVGEAETPFYVEALKDKRLRKDYPMWAIEVAGDERAIGPVADYVVGILRKARRPKPGPLPEAYVRGLRFLARYRDSRPELAEVFALAREVMPKLPRGHQEELLETVKQL